MACTGASNVVTRSEGTAGAVLLRAGEVVEGLEVARLRRTSATSDRDLARGPARLTTALGVTGDLDGADLFARGPVCGWHCLRPAPPMSP